MTIDQVVSALIYLVSIFILFLRLAVVGYYLGLVFAIGGVLVGPSAGIIEDLIDIFFYGIIAIVLLNLSNFINDKIILYKFDNVKEIIEDRNAGTGVVVAANHIAIGLIIAGAITGEGGDLITAAVFWILGQLVLIVAGFVYNRITPYDVHNEIEKDNVAVGVAFAGMIIAIGNVIRIGLSGDFISWTDNLSKFFGFVIFGLILLPLLRFVTDKLLLPGVKLTDELVHQEKPNIGAGAIEAFSYIAASFFLGWVI